MNTHFCNTPKIYVYPAPVDLRKGIDGLSAIIQGANMDPFDIDSCYLFTNKHHTRIKAITWDGTGQILLLKRLDSGCFKWRFVEEGIVAIKSSDLDWLLSGREMARRNSIPKEKIKQPKKASKSA